MTDPLLSYQTPAPASRTPLLTAACIYLIVLGALYCLVGTCGSASIVYLIFAAPRALRISSSLLGLFAALFFLLSFGSGISFIWTGFLLRRLSRIAALVALVLALVDAGLAFGYDILNLVAYLRMTRSAIPAATAIGSIVFYLLASLANVIAAILLWRVLRQMRRAPLAPSVPTGDPA